MKKIKVYKADGTFYEVNDPGVVVPDPVDPDPAPTLDDRVATLEATSAEMTEALDLLLSGVTE